MTTEKKLYAALAVLAILGLAVWMQQQKKQKVEDAHTLEGAAAALPVLSVNDDAIKTIDSISISKPGAGDAGAPTTFEFKKKGEEDWELLQPVQAKANNSNIKLLLENIKKLKVTEEISSKKDAYDRWGVTEQKAIHTVFKAGDKTVLDLYFGDSGSRGQMTRLPDKEGVYAITGYSKYLYERDTKDWRDRTIFKFENDKIEKVEIENEHGKFVFAKADGKWQGKFAKKGKGPAKDIPEFKEAQVTSMLNSFKNLSGVNFAEEDKTAEAVGLTEPAGTIRILEKGGSAKYELMVGNEADGSNRYAKSNGNELIYTISSWPAGWVTAELSKFQEKKKEEEAKDEGDDKDKKDKSEKTAAKKPEAKGKAPAPKAPAPKAPAPKTVPAAGKAE